MVKELNWENYQFAWKIICAKIVEIFVTWGCLSKKSLFLVSLGGVVQFEPNFAAKRVPSTEKVIPN